MRQKKLELDMKTRFVGIHHMITILKRHGLDAALAELLILNY